MMALQIENSLAAQKAALQAAWGAILASKGQYRDVTIGDPSGQRQGRIYEIPSLEAGFYRWQQGEDRDGIWAFTDLCKKGVVTQDFEFNLGKRRLGRVLSGTA